MLVEWLESEDNAVLAMMEESESDVQLHILSSAAEDDWRKVIRISKHTPFSVSVVEGDVWDLESSAAQFCFGDKQRTLQQVLVFVHDYVQEQQAEEDDTWGDVDQEDDEPFTTPRLESITAREPPSSQARRASFSCVLKESLAELQHSMIQRVITAFGCTRSAAASLLYHAGWEVDSVIGSPLMEQCRKIGLSETALQRTFSPVPDGRRDEELCCGVCMCDGPLSESFALVCNHRFCVDCFREHLRVAVVSGAPNGGSFLTLRCPEFKCSELIGAEVFQMLLPQHIFVKYQQRLVESLVNDSQCFSWCPKPGCDVAVGFSVRRKTVECKCGFRFCFRCLEEAHAPCSCSNAVNWRARDKGSESLNTKYLMNQTKPCPNCGTRTKKDGGCMYLKCTQCSQAWCWQCGKSDHHVWDCNRPSYEASTTPSDTNHYLFYYERFFNHTESLKFAENQVQKVQQSITALVDKGQPYKDFAFLLDSVRLIIQCRDTLRWTYSAAFFIEDERQRELFEYQQGKLEEYTEKLSQLTEMRLEELVESRMQVLDYTTMLHQYLHHIEALSAETCSPDVQQAGAAPTGDS